MKPEIGMKDPVLESARLKLQAKLLIEVSRELITGSNRLLKQSRQALWQQSENVVFGQSRNVVLTAPGLGDAGRTTTDDPGRQGPAGCVKED
jgi:hypothetical protein